jgi:hypothetical protein
MIPWTGSDLGSAIVFRLLTGLFVVRLYGQIEEFGWGKR